jgi:WXG100 family type VII secretion target
MANAIKVTPEELLTMASKLEGWTDQYQACYKRIYNTVNDLASTWGGEAQTQYFTQIDGFNNDFENLYLLFNKYATYLRNTAQKYQEAEANIKQSASSLSTGI